MGYRPVSGVNTLIVTSSAGPTVSSSPAVGGSSVCPRPLHASHQFAQYQHTHLQQQQQQFHSIQTSSHPQPILVHTASSILAEAAAATTSATTQSALIAPSIVSSQAIGSVASASDSLSATSQLQRAIIIPANSGHQHHQAQQQTLQSCHVSGAVATSANNNLIVVQRTGRRLVNSTPFVQSASNMPLATSSSSVSVPNVPLGRQIRILGLPAFSATGSPSSSPISYAATVPAVGLSPANQPPASASAGLSVHHFQHYQQYQPQQHHHTQHQQYQLPQPSKAMSFHSDQPPLIQSQIPVQRQPVVFPLPTTLSNVALSSFRCHEESKKILEASVREVGEKCVF
ncbi:unnamed protein product [Protopolystoma xenopodis]|uniref:Uncharacterized protein n=1 Tax=Protopolystoma xenopodis TaxID=117903 RepID=A0A448WSL0_9PLAT|nr:unnamed protein product [Protopolystoma xenopodis]